MYTLTFNPILQRVYCLLNVHFSQDYGEYPDASFGLFYKEDADALYPVFNRSTKYADGCFYCSGCGGYYHKVEGLFYTRPPTKRTTPKKKCDNNKSKWYRIEV